MKQRNLILSALFLCVFLAPATAAADALKGVDPLSENQLDQLCGGFTLPNGALINVGITNVVSLNGTIIGNSTFSFNGTNVTSSTTGTTQVQSGSGTTTVQLSPAGSAIITNTASNVSLDAARTVTVNLSGISQMGLQGLANISAVQLQAISAFKNGLH